MPTPWWLVDNAWESVTAPLSNGSNDRRPEILRRVLEQFHVELAPRYRPREGNTWCFTYVWDVTRALACEIPHWRLAKELNANAAIDWLNTSEARRHGWGVVGARDAMLDAALGSPTVATWKNPKPGGHGHIAMVVPPNPGEDPSTVWISQAGAHNFLHGPISSPFGFGRLPVSFFAHS